MEPFEYNDNPTPEQEQPPVPPVAEEPPVQQDPPQYVPPQNYGAYHGTGAGRRESPYANSPYVRQEPRPEYRYQYQPQTQPPQKPPKVKKERKPRKGF